MGRIATIVAPFVIIAGMVIPASLYAHSHGAKPACPNRTIHYEDGSTLTLNCHGDRVSSTSVPW